MVNVSRQKIYDIIVAAEKKYGTFEGMTIFATYVEMKGLRLHFIREKCSPMSGSLILTHCFKRRSRFEITEQVAEDIEFWLKNKTNK